MINDSGQPCRDKNTGNAHDSQRNGNRPANMQRFNIQRSPGKGKEKNIDGQGAAIEVFFQCGACLAEILYKKSGAHADQQGFEMKGLSILKLHELRKRR